jgi:hypothetical protein
MRRLRSALPLACLAIAAAAGPLWAVREPERTSPAAQRAFRHAGLDIADRYQPLGGLPADLAAPARHDLAALGVAESDAYLDLRSGRWGP